MIAREPGQPDQPALAVLSTDPDLGAAEILRRYAQRWAIERLFLSWKSHGWQLEQVGLSDLTRIRSLLTGLVLAENTPMLRLTTSLGFTPPRQVEEGVVAVDLPL